MKLGNGEQRGPKGMSRNVMIRTRSGRTRWRGTRQARAAGGRSDQIGYTVLVDIRQFISGIISLHIRNVVITARDQALERRAVAHRVDAK